jgi:hypothetical protein
MSYQLGIDVGTTYTGAAVCRSAERRWVEPEVVTLGTRAATVPSVLFMAADGGIVVGEAAERRALTDPDRVVREFKRRIGDPTPIVVGGRAWAPEELSARLVRWVVDRVAEREGGPAAQIAVTHPASWGSHKKDLLTAALAAQGLRVALLAEPQAAAFHYATQERVAPGSTIAVYDLGGGTFDAAVVRKADRSRPRSAPPGSAPRAAGGASTGSAASTSTTSCSTTSARACPPRSATSTTPTRACCRPSRACGGSAPRPRRRCRPTRTCRSRCSCPRAAVRCACTAPSSSR